MVYAILGGLIAILYGLWALKKIEQRMEEEELRQNLMRRYGGDDLHG